MNRYESTKKVGLLGIISNIFLLAIKLIVSLISNSKAMLADAINSAGDIFSSLMTFIGSKIAASPSDEDHNFGHGKAEYIFSLLISIFMLIVALKIFSDSILAIVSKPKFIFSYALIIVSFLTIIIKLSLYIYCEKLLSKDQNILIKASSKDHRNDAILSLGTLISIILCHFGFYYFDGIFGAITSIYIFLTGISIFLESYKILMDVSLAKEEKEEIINFIMQDKRVLNVSSFATVATGYKYIAVITIDVLGSLDTFTSHSIADTLEIKIKENYPKISETVIHVNPIKKPQNEKKPQNKRGKKN